MKDEVPFVILIGASLSEGGWREPYVRPKAH
jgi:hypothetical protein